MTKGTILASLLIVFVVIVAWNRDVARAVKNADLDRQTDAALEASQQWRERFEVADQRSRGVDTILVAIQQRSRETLAAADETRAEIDRILLADPRSDNLAVTSIPTDWHALYQLRSLEVDRLRLVISTQREEISVLLKDRDDWKATATAALPVTLQLDTALEAERDARACRLLGTIKMPCIPSSLKTAATALGAITLWEKVIRPLVRIP